ncbi:MAG: hypothetical protein ACLQIB_05595 [Isosphaeraceae bacterium]
MLPTYWLTVFTAETWKEFQDHGGDVAGFGERRWASVQKIRPGDYLLCYVTRVSRFVGLLEAVGEPFFDRRAIWSSAVFPSRVPVRIVLALEPEQGIPVLEILEKLRIFDNLPNPKGWSGYFQTSPSRWSVNDGETITKALQDAKAR